MLPAKFPKTLLLISAVLGGILIAILIRKRPAHPAAPFASITGSAVQISLQFSTTTLTFVQNTGGWDVHASTEVSFRADPDKVKTLLNGLKDLQIDDVISEKGIGASDFEMNPESATVVMLQGKDQAVLGGGTFGKQAQDFNHIYFRYFDKPTIYLAHGLVRGELGEPALNSWRDHMVLNLTEDQVITLLITGPGIKMSLARSSDTWSLNGRVVDPAPVWGTLGVLAHLRADDFVDLTVHPEWTPDKLKYALVILQLKAGRTHIVHIGRLDAVSKRYPVAVDQSPNVFAVAENTIKGILRNPNEFKPASPPPVK